MAFKFESSEFKKVFGELLNFANRRNELDVANKELIQKIAVEIDVIKKVFAIGTNLSHLDEMINFSTQQIGFDFVEIVEDLISRFNITQNPEIYEKMIFQSASLIYIYLREYEFQVKSFHPSIGIEIGRFLVNVGGELKNNNEFGRFIDFGDRDVPFSYLMEIFHSEEIKNLKDLSKVKSEILEQANSFNKKICDYENSFIEKEKTVKELEKRLEKNKQTYDFVLLNKGFKELYEQKKLELKERRDGYSDLAAWLICTPLAVIVISVFLVIFGFESKLHSLWFLAIPISTLMLFLFYFSRVGLQHVRSVQSQMMQLELRMALCQFIHNYAEDSEKLHAKNKAGFEKFENIIFSPLVSSDDKIPTTFDGIEQLAKLVNEFRK